MLGRSLLLFLCAASGWAQVFTGQVLEDHSGTPLPSAVIRIAKPGDRYLAAELETDREGRFEASGLAPGEYRLEVQRTGYASAKLAATLTANGTSVVARLIKRGIIAGHVRDSQGPVAGATVYAMPKSAGVRPPTFSTPSATVDGTGEYRIRNLAPGEYIAVVSYGASTRAMGSSGIPGTLARTGSGYSAYPTNAKPDTLAITGGEELRNIDFTLLGRPLFTVSGKVDPKADEAYFILGLVDPTQPGLATAIAGSEKDGTFKFTGIPEGQYRLLLASTSRARNGLGFLLPEQPLFGATRVNVAAANVENVVVSTNATRSVTFQLKVANGCPAATQLMLTALEDWGSQMARTITLNSGQPTVLKDLAPTQYSLSTPATTNTCYLESDRVLDLSDSAPSGPVEAAFAQEGVVRGKLDSGAQSATGFRIALASGQDAGTFEFATPDTQGRFTFPGLRPGRYRIAAFPAGSRVADFTKMIEFEVRGGSNAEIDLVAPLEVAR